MSDIDDLKNKYQVDHLILLVGGNPLPNAISGNLLVKPKGRITLIHSRSVVDETKEAFIPNTEKVADRICASFDPAMQLQVTKKPLDNPADRLQIQTAVREALKDEQGSFGLNYTGGTKAMSVHAYRTVEEIAINQRKNVIFSYLDTHSRKMMVDEAKYNADMGNLKYPINSTPYKVSEFYFSLEKMLTLHNWELSGQQPDKKPVLPLTSRQMAQINTHHWDMFKSWYGDFMKLNNGDTIALPNAPELQPFCDAIREDVRFKGDTLNTTDLVAYFASFGKGWGWGEVKGWLTGKWMESAVLNAIQKFPEKQNVQWESCKALHPYRIGNDKIHFDLDCAAVRGYQLFAFSCTIASNVVSTEHLIEVSVRAKQIAGDAARICLVCNHDDPQTIRKKILKSMDEGTNLLVLGKNDIAKLDEKIEKWIEKCISYS